MTGTGIFLHTLGGLAVFLYGMKVFSEGLQKMAGGRLRAIIHRATSNRFSGTAAGFLVTCAVQSSSATTVMIVSFCSAGLLTLTQALGMIFGANIGTTTTGWLVSMLGFKVNIMSFALPAIGIGFFTQFIKCWRWPHRFGEVLVGFGLLFLGLHLIKETMQVLTHSPEVLTWVTRFDASDLGPRLLVVLVGTLLTILLQSSSAMMVITLTAASSGLISFETAVALVLGENIGTTATANLASIGAPVTARRAARGHLIFNAFGVLWAVLLFNPLLKLVDLLVPGSPYLGTEAVFIAVLPLHIAAFHTVFNVINTGVALPLIHPLQRLTEFLVPQRQIAHAHDLKYLATPLSHTPELALPAAQREVDRMAGIVLTMLEEIAALIGNGEKMTEERIRSVLQKEETTDALEHKINTFLSKLAHAHLSTATNKRVISLISMINDLERMGDHGEKLAHLLQKAKSDNAPFSPEGQRDLQRMVDKAIAIVTPMRRLILTPSAVDPIPHALKRERELNQLRDEVRSAHVNRITQGICSPAAGLLFADMVTSLEKMGDHAFNVIEAAVGIK